MLQELGGISTAMERDKVLLQELLKTAKDLMRNAEVAVRSFVLLRSRFPRAAGTALTSSSLFVNSTFAPSVGTGAQGSAQAVPPTLPVEFYSGIPFKPSPFLLHTVSRFEHQLQEYRQLVEELERLLFADNNENGKYSTHKFPFAVSSSGANKYSRLFYSCCCKGMFLRQEPFTAIPLSLDVK
ncbi:hypothetical protein L7F22_040007 [Adiantum nelumboides]|nr:hypothetical protein [Adiantum nelumboides]